jgi:integrase/recombinase XerC
MVTQAPGIGLVIAMSVVWRMSKPLSHWAVRFLEDLADARRCSPHTVAAYRRDLQRFLDSQSLGAKAPGSRILTTRRFQDYLSTLAISGLSNRSIARAAATLRSFLSFLHRRGGIPDDLSDRVPSVKFAPNLPRFVGEGQMHRWLESLPNRTRWEKRDCCLVALLYATGARLSEVVGLNWGDFDDEGHTVRLFGKRSRERIVPTGDRVADMLAGLRAESPPESVADGKPIFVNRKGGRITGRSIARIVRRSFGVATGGLISPHRLRHTFATHMLDRGADLMALKELLGHQNVATTQIYTHTTPHRLARVYREAFPLEKELAENSSDAVQSRN